MTQPRVPVDAKTPDWPRKIATAINWLINNVTTAGGAAIWGGITGTLSDQTDLQAALDAKEPTITSGTTSQYWRGDKTFHQPASSDLSDGASLYKSGGTDVAIADGGTGASTAAAARVNLLPSITGNSLKTLRVNAGETDVEWATASGSGTVTTTGSPASGNLAKFSGATSITSGDLSGDVTTSGTLVATIANGAVTLAKQANMASASVVYRKTAGSGAPEVQTLATLKTDLGLTGTNSGDQTITLTGDATGSGTGSFAVTLANSGVSAASYTAANITVDAKGRVTAAASSTAITRLYVSVAGTGTPASNVETDLASYTLPGGTLSANGMGVRITAWGTLAATTRSRTVTIYFGATANPTFVSTSSSVTQWRSDVTILRTGAATQTGSAHSGMGISGLNEDAVNRSRAFAPAETMSGNIVIRLTGTVAGAAAANDIICTGFLIELIP